MGEICLQCGDIGFKKKLIYCFKCTQSARHSYCMDGLIFPETKHHHTIRWLCDECDESDDEFANIPGPSRAEEEPVAYAEPMIRSVWVGTFDMMITGKSTSWTTNRRIIVDGVHGFLSSKACVKVRETVGLLGGVIRFEMVGRASAWPRSFADGMGPTDDNIGVYFFPLLAKQEEYNRVVWDMIRHDLAMTSYVDAQLLVFPSTELPQRAWRFQGRFYLWGVFKGKLPPCTL